MSLNASFLFRQERGFVMNTFGGPEKCYKKINNVSFLGKLDGVGPVDNRPSPTKLHHFVQKKKKKK